MITEEDKKLWLETMSDVQVKSVAHFGRVRKIEAKDYHSTKLDLHSMTIDEAYQRVVDFIESCYYVGVREILIITGKSEQETSIQREFQFWMELKQIQDYIVSFAPAHFREGGDGAWKVRIKKNGNLRNR